MAKLSQPIATTTGPATPAPSSTVSASPVGTAVVGLANSGLELWGQYQKKAENERQQAQLGQTQNEILNLQDNAIYQQQQAEQIKNQISSFYEDDGQLSGDELKMLGTLEKRLKTFDLLSSGERQVRRNALFRQALNDPANAGLQTSIMKLFGGNSVEPPQDPTQVAAEQAMDQKYGSGNWTPTDFAKEQGMGLYLRRMQTQAGTNTDMVINNMPAISSGAMSGVSEQIRQAYANKGALTSEEKENLRFNIIQTQNQLREEMVRAVGENGKYMTVKQRENLEEALAQEIAVLDKFMNADGNMFDTYSIHNQLKSQNELKDMAIENNVPNVLRAAKNAFVNGANNSFGGYDSMMKFLTEPKNAPILEGLGFGSDQQQVAMEMSTSVMNYILTADAKTKQFMATWGNTRLAAAIAGNVGIPNATTTEEVERAVDVTTSNTGDPDDMSTFAEVVTNATAKAAIAANGGGNAVRKKALREFRVMSDKMGLTQAAVNAFAIENGEIILSEGGRELLGSNPRSAVVNEKRLIQYLRDLNSILAEYPDDINPEELINIYKGPTQQDINNASDEANRANVQRLGSQILNENTVDGETPVPMTEEERIRSEADKLAPVDIKDFLDKPDSNLASSGFIDALSRLEAGDMGFDSINAVPTGNFQGHTNARSYITPALQERFGSASLTERSVGELIAIGSEWALAEGSGERASGAMGFGQITPSTMRMLVDNGVVRETDKFDERTQLRMVEWLLYNKQPSVKAYLDGSSDDLDAALAGLGAEWEAFTKAGNKETGRRILKSLRGGKA